MALPPAAARLPLLEADAAARASEGRTAQDEGRHSTQEELVVGIAAAVNPLNRAFVSLPLPDNIDGHLHFRHAPVAGRRQQQLCAPVRALSSSIEARLKNIKEDNLGGAASVGSAGRFFQSASVLASASFGQPIYETGRASQPMRSVALPAGRLAPSMVTSACGCSSCTCSVHPREQSSFAPVQIRVEPIAMERLPRDWELMMGVVERCWEAGVGSAIALRKLQQGQPERRELDKKLHFGRASSSMLAKRPAIFKAMSRAGGWAALRDQARVERVKRAGRGQRFGYNDVHTFRSFMLRRAWMQRTDGLIYSGVLNCHSAGHERSFLSTNCILGVRPTRAQRWSGPQKKHGPQKQAKAASAAAEAAATLRLQTGGNESHRPQPGPALNHTQRRNPPVLRERHIHHPDGRLALQPDATPQPPHQSRPPPV